MVDQTTPSAPTPPDAQLLPVRMINEYVYCPRLFHLMHVEGRWAENEYTEDGKRVHRRVDRLDHVLPHATAQEDDHEKIHGDEPPDVHRSVPLSSERLGITAKLDLVATDGDEAVPVETKRGRVPDNPERSWPPERVQVMLQGLLLREHGYRTSHGVLYFAGSRTRVDIPFTADLEQQALQAVRDARIAASSTVLPPPLDESTKCHGCSLNSICLPDETIFLRQPAGERDSVPRLLFPSRQDARPLYVQEQGARVGKRGQVLVVRKDGEELGHLRLKDMSQLVLCGNITVSAPALRLLCDASIPILHVSTGHWFAGVTHGFGLRNAYDRAAQFQAASDPERCLSLAIAFVLAKSRNQRTMLRRNARPEPVTELQRMRWTLAKIPQARALDVLLGFEGTVARSYFKEFHRMLTPRDMDAQWEFKSRNRRPPRDPVNAMLSFAYAMLAKECTVALMAEGLDPWWGFFHQPRHGRPALSLDLMEEFRPLIADSAVLTAVNTGMVSARGFVQGAAGCAMQPAARKALIRAYEARLEQLVTHPIFDYRCSWRSVIRIQARLLSRYLRGDIPDYIGITTR